MDRDIHSMKKWRTRAPFDMRQHILPDCLQTPIAARQGYEAPQSILQIWKKSFKRATSVNEKLLNYLYIHLYAQKRLIMTFLIRC